MEQGWRPRRQQDCMVFWRRMNAVSCPQTFERVVGAFPHLCPRAGCAVCAWLAGHQAEPDPDAFVARLEVRGGFRGGKTLELAARRSAVIRGAFMPGDSHEADRRTLTGDPCGE